MRFAAATILFAGAVMAGTEASQDYTTVTDVETVTSCGPTVTDCPARKASATSVNTWSSSWSVSSAAVDPSWTASSEADPSWTASSEAYPSWTASSAADPSWTTTPVVLATPATTASGYWAGNSTGSALPVASGTGSWFTECDCECDSCTSAGDSGSLSGTGGSGNGSLSLSSPSSIVTGSASQAAPALLAVVAGLVALLA